MQNVDVALLAARALGETLGMKQVLATLIARHAREFPDPEHYVTTLLAPLQEAASDYDDPVSDALFAAAGELGAFLERSALSML